MCPASLDAHMRRSSSLPDDFCPIDPDLVRPFVYEGERTLSLHFDMSATQSRMRRDDPTALELEYTRTMMGFLLFEPEPKSILMIGLGGGSLAKYCYRHLPQSQITVVEINPHVIELRDAFCVPADDRRFRVVRDDGAAFVACAGECYDVVLVDGFTYEGQPERLCTARFYEDCRATLTESGVMVVNLHLEDARPNALVDAIACAFDGAVQVVFAEAGNRIAFATRTPESSCRTGDLRRRWAALADVHKRTLGTSARRIASGLRWPRLDGSAQASAQREPLRLAAGCA
jgi:spermidine synthase